MPDDPCRTLLALLVHTWDTDQLEAFETAMQEAHVYLGIPSPTEELNSEAATNAIASAAQKAAGKLTH